jgi:cytochrome P450
VTAHCPINDSFNPFDAGYLRDPFGVFRELRDIPVFYSTELDMYVVTGYDDVSRILLDPESFSAKNVAVPARTPSAEAAARLEAAGFRSNPTFFSDAPRHRTIRQISVKALSPRRLAQLEPQVIEYVDELVQAMAVKPVVDLRADLAHYLPAAVGLGLIGIPRSDWDLLLAWSDEREKFTYGSLSPQEEGAAVDAYIQFWTYICEFVDRRMKEPSNDFTSELVKSHVSTGGPLSTDDINHMVFTITLAAHNTTANLVLNGLRWLLTYRENWEALCEDPALIPGAVEEALRYESSVIGWRRMARVDTEVAGCAIPSGATLLLLLGSANRDGRAFPDPDKFEVNRVEARRHLAFGKGVHLCLGAPLARTEMRILLESLTKVMPDLRLTDHQTVQYPPSISIRGPISLFAEPRIKQHLGS